MQKNQIIGMRISIIGTIADRLQKIMVLTDRGNVQVVSIIFVKDTIIVLMEDRKVLRSFIRRLVIDVFAAVVSCINTDNIRKCLICGGRCGKIWQAVAEFDSATKL